MGGCCGCPHQGQCGDQDDNSDDTDLVVDAPENDGEGEAEDN